MAIAMWRMWVGVFSALLILFPIVSFAQEDGLWDALKQGQHVVLMRHALAPGTGDPSHFDLERCDTQRNLDDRGRAQAIKIGDRFRANGIDNAAVYTSQWCRCRETARLLDLGAPEDLVSINSFFREMSQSGPQTVATQAWLQDQALEGPIVLVTHFVNIRALTGLTTSSGEMVFAKVLEDGSLDVIGTVETDP